MVRRRRKAERVPTMERLQRALEDGVGMQLSYRDVGEINRVINDLRAQLDALALAETERVAKGQKDQA